MVAQQSKKNSGGGSWSSDPSTWLVEPLGLQQHTHLPSLFSNQSILISNFWDPCSMHYGSIRGMISKDKRKWIWLNFDRNQNNLNGKGQEQPNQTYQTKPVKSNLPNQTYQTYQTKPTKPSKPTKPKLPNQTYQTKPSKPNLPNQTYQTKHNNPNIPDQTYQIKQTWICFLWFSVNVTIRFVIYLKHISHLLSIWFFELLIWFLSSQPLVP